MARNLNLPAHESAQEIAPIRIPEFQKVTNPKKRAWLVAYAQVGTITGAKKLTGMDWRNHYHWLGKDPEYKTAFEIARQIAGDMIEDAIIEAAMDGDEVPVIYEGKITQHYRRKSDVLRMFALKARKPEYRDSFPLAAMSSAPVSIAITYPAPERVIHGETKQKPEI